MLAWVLAGSIMAQQQTASPKISFSSQNYLGVLEGGSGTSFLAQSINGVRYKSLFTGIGVGLDHYFERSVPVFLSVGSFLPSKKWPFYFHGDAGLDFPWVTRMNSQRYSRGEFSPGFYWAGGMGYKFSFKKQPFGLMVNAGYSFKHMIQREELMYICLDPPCDVVRERYDYRLKRMSLKLGIIF